MSKRKPNKGYIIYAEYDVEYVKKAFKKSNSVTFEYMDNGKRKDRIITPSLRMRTILRTQKCSKCGIKGNIFRLEANGGKPHLNLYHKFDIRGGYRMMTCDHIIPRSEGGPNLDVNTHVLCIKHNRDKGSRIETQYFTIPLINEIRKFRPVILEGLGGIQ